MLSANICEQAITNKTEKPQLFFTSASSQVQPLSLSASQPSVEGFHLNVARSLDIIRAAPCSKKNLIWSPPNFSLQPRSRPPEESRVILCNQDRLEPSRGDAVGTPRCCRCRLETRGSILSAEPTGRKTELRGRRQRSVRDAPVRDSRRSRPQTHPQNPVVPEAGSHSACSDPARRV
ncbi:unnamed protein product [Pleuronectes platessa]|uniref:Uncharacterized protein n=1 Tax=Pleuronectes platessa TaxID=8262 RepID=A0A9N7U1A2_PLEPL|nr:unnamed protein product [Pleuronectes platessa]